MCLVNKALFSPSLGTQSYGAREFVLTNLGLGTKQSKLEHDLTVCSLLSTNFILFYLSLISLKIN
jgi:hypothetical protein